MGDYLLRFLAKDAGVRGFIAVTTETVQEAAARHETGPTATVALSRGLTAAALMGALLKVKQRVALKFEGSGPLRRVLVEADSYGRLRGYVGEPDIGLPRSEGRLDIVNAIGQAGLLTVVRDTGDKELYESVTPLETSDFEGDLNAYFEQSEQIPTLVQLGEVVDENDQLVAAGGLLLQIMPGSDGEAQLALLRERLQELPPVVDMLNSGQTPEAIAATIFAGLEYQELEQRDLRFDCDCSWERTRAALLSLGADEIEDMLRTDGEAIVHCHYCHESYEFNEFDLEVILMEIGAEAE